MKACPIPKDFQVEFNKLFDLKPQELGKVLVYNREQQVHEEKQIFRSYNCYLNVPQFDPQIKKSYMFLSKEASIPQEFMPFIELAKSIDSRYNQLVVNWYEADEYIEMHRDCTSKMLSPECPILMMNLNESDDIYKLRHLTFQSVESGEFSSVPLLNNYYYIIENNLTHRHYSGKGVERRISLTFRMIKE